MTRTPTASGLGVLLLVVALLHAVVMTTAQGVHTRQARYSRQGFRESGEADVKVLEAGLYFPRRHLLQDISKGFKKSESKKEVEEDEAKKALPKSARGTATKRDEEFFIKAVEKGDLHEVRNELDRGVSMELRHNPSNMTAVLIAAEKGHHDVLKHLIKESANLDVMNCDEWRPMHLAALHGHTKALDALVKGGVNVDDRTIDGATPLYIAAQAGQAKAVKYLMSKKADINARYWVNGYTPLMIASERGHTDAIMELLKRWPDVFATNDEGGTALHRAALSFGGKQVISILLENRADMELRDSSGETPLHYAAWNGQKPNIEILLSKGANKTAVGELGGTPLDQLCECVHSGLKAFCNFHWCSNSIQDMMNLFNQTQDS